MSPAAKRFVQGTFRIGVPMRKVLSLGAFVNGDEFGVYGSGKIGEYLFWGVVFIFQPTNLIIISTQTIGQEDFL